jgi:hypothetical protein
VRLWIISAVLAVVFAAGLPQNASAQGSSPPAGWCSDSGDTCLSTEHRDGARVVELRWPVLYADSAEICVLAPSGRKDCVTAPAGALGEDVFGVSLDWARAFPHRGPGVYLLEGPPALADVGFAVGSGRRLCRPEGNPDLPGFRYRTQTRRVSCNAATRIQVRAERVRCAESLCAGRVRRVLGYRCRFGSLSSTRFEQAITCTRGQRWARWLRTYD